MPPSDQIPLQVDMFTGKQVDTRTAAQKRADAALHEWAQMSMFSMKEAPVGVLKNKPIVDISHLPSPTLVLVKEDTRSEEEKETARRKEMEANTYRLFDDPTLYEETTPLDEVPEKIAPLPQDAVETSEKVSVPCVSAITYSPQETCYREIVAAAREDITTLWVDKVYAARLAARLPLAMLEATQEGLTPSEIACAVHIGKAMGKTDKETMGEVTADVMAVEPAMEQEVEPEPSFFQPKGLRAQLRQTSVKLRTR